MITIGRHENIHIHRALEELLSRAKFRRAPLDPTWGTELDPRGVHHRLRIRRLVPVNVAVVDRRANRQRVWRLLLYYQ